MNLTGTWQGEYVFDEAAGDPDAAGVAGQVVRFTLQLQQGWLGAVTGTATDDARTGFPEPGKVKGKLKGKVLEFRRVMPVLRLVHETSRLSLAQWAERRRVVMDTDQPSPPLLFEGELNDAGTAIEGAWRMPGVTIEVPGSYQRLVIPAVGGTWRARRDGAA
jgi:hypothetical protein